MLFQEKLFASFLNWDQLLKGKKKTRFGQFFTFKERSQSKSVTFYREIERHNMISL